MRVVLGKHNTIPQVYSPYDFCNNIFASLASFTVRTYCVIHITYEMCDGLFMVLVRLLVSKRL